MSRALCSGSRAVTRMWQGPRPGNDAAGRTAPVAADLRVGAGTFGWAGAYGCNVNIDPKENMVSIIMMQTATGTTVSHPCSLKTW